MANEWEFAKTTGKCAKTGRPLAEGEAYYAVLIENPDTFERRDYSFDAWDGPPEGSFCYWRGKIPIREKNKTMAVDFEVLTHLFLRLEDADSEPKQRFRFMLALLLMRKRLLKLEQTLQQDEHEYWILRLVKDQSQHKVLNPQLTGEQVDQLSQQLTTILSGDVKAIETLDHHENDSMAESEIEDASETETNPDIVNTESEDGIATP
ncbi:MAG: hypothetical protein JSV03_09635 [Planctomycetota bacterium]|nr:MAG: hypothetical protein JSV03_09635 [Planctomycetota bacterium]